VSNNRNIFYLHRAWVEISFKTSGLKPIHHALFYHLVFLFNRLAWKEEIGVYGSQVMEELGIGNRSTFKTAIHKLQDAGVIKIVFWTRNQHSPHLISLCNFEQSVNTHGTLNEHSLHPQSTLNEQSLHPHGTLTAPSVNASITSNKVNNSINNFNINPEEKNFQPPPHIDRQAVSKSKMNELAGDSPEEWFLTLQSDYNFAEQIQRQFKAKLDKNLFEEVMDQAKLWQVEIKDYRHFRNFILKHLREKQKRDKADQPQSATYKKPDDGKIFR